MPVINSEKLKNTLRLVSLATNDDVIKSLCLDVLEENENDCRSEIMQTCYAESIDNLHESLSKQFGYNKL